MKELKLLEHFILKTHSSKKHQSFNCHCVFV